MSGCFQRQFKVTAIWCAVSVQEALQNGTDIAEIQ